jgi:hypothetical protein
MKISTKFSSCFTCIFFRGEGIFSYDRDLKRVAEVNKCLNRIPSEQKYYTRTCKCERNILPVLMAVTQVTISCLFLVTILWDCNSPELQLLFLMQSRPSVELHGPQLHAQFSSPTIKYVKELNQFLSTIRIITFSLEITYYKSTDSLYITSVRYNIKVSKCC